MDRISRLAGSAGLRLVARAEALRGRCLRRTAGRILRRLQVVMACRRAEAELGALNGRALHDLGLDRGGIMYAARYGRGERSGSCTASAAGRGPATQHAFLESEDT